MLVVVIWVIEFDLGWYDKEVIRCRKIVWYMFVFSINDYEFVVKIFLKFYFVCCFKLIEDKNLNEMKVFIVI